MVIMGNPMTTQAAHQKHLCGYCRTGLDSCKGGNCVESMTCSVRCDNCQGRVWFTGNMGEQAQEYECPYCGSHEYHKDLGPRG